MVNAHTQGPGNTVEQHKLCSPLAQGVYSTRANMTISWSGGWYWKTIIIRMKHCTDHGPKWHKSTVYWQLWWQSAFHVNVDQADCSPRRMKWNEGGRWKIEQTKWKGEQKRKNHSLSSATERRWDKSFKALGTLEYMALHCMVSPLAKVPISNNGTSWIEPNTRGKDCKKLIFSL